LHFNSDVGVGECGVQSLLLGSTCARFLPVALNSQRIFKISMIEQANKPAVSLQL